MRTRASIARFVAPLIAGIGLLPAVGANAAAPTISGTPPATATVDTRYSFRPQAYDADGNRLRFWIWNKPSWASFDSRTGRLFGTPRTRHVGTYSNISIGVTDGRSRVTLPRFSITVQRPGSTTPPPPTENPPPANAPPIITGTPPAQVVQGQAYAFTPTASDPDGDSLTFSISNKPSWATFSQSTGRLTGTPSAANLGNYGNIVISVSDGQQSVSLAPFSIAVVGVATGSATLTWTPPTTRTDGSALTNLAGYRVLWGTTRGNYPSSTRLTNPGLTSYVVSNLAPATYYFVVVAIDANGGESGYSNEASKTIN